MLMTPEQAAEYLGCKPKTVRVRAARGELPGVKVGRDWRFPSEALDEALRIAAMANMAKRRPAPTAVAVPKARKSRRSPMPTLIDMR